MVSSFEAYFAQRGFKIIKSRFALNRITGQGREGENLYYLLSGPEEKRSLLVRDLGCHVDLEKVVRVTTAPVLFGDCLMFGERVEEHYRYKSVNGVVNIGFM